MISGDLGANSAPLWIPSLLNLKHFGVHFGPFGSLLDPFVLLRGAFWVSLGSLWSLLVTMLAPFWPLLGLLGALAETPGD